MRLKGFVSSALVSLVAICCTASAEDENLPTVHTVTCATVCANSTGPVPDFHPLPSFPQDDLGWYGVYVEGYVLLHYTIEPDGHVDNIAQLELVGPKNFADSTQETVKSWTYKPATLNGKAVATCRTLMTTFRVRTASVGGRPELVRAYRDAVTQLKDSKPDDAMATLNEAAAMPKLNFYERGMVANLTSLIALQKGDYLTAQNQAKLATDHGLDELPRPAAENLLQTRIKASLAPGDMVDALVSVDRLKAGGGLDQDSPIMKMVNDAKTKADGMPVFGTTAKIPESEAEGIYLGLYRRNFAFTNITGTLDGFVLSCKQQAVESKITATAEWHVPKDWSDCHILVRGTPGTTFKLAQATE